MVKLILLALGIWIAFRILKSRGRNVKQGEASMDKISEDMVCCAHCGVNLPRSESIISHGEFFCTNEHRQLHQK